MGIATVDKEAVGVVALGQGDQASSDASLPKTSGEALRCLLAAAIAVRIQGQIDGLGTVTELPKLARIEVGSQRAGDVVKAGLPQRGVVEKALDQNHFRIGLGLLPCVQAALATRQKAVRRRRHRNAATI